MIYINAFSSFCAAGKNNEELWENVSNGNQAGIKKTKTSTNEEFFSARIDDSLLSNSSSRYDMRIMKIQEAALNQIADKINFAKEKFSDERIAVCVGSCDNGTEFSVAGHREFFKSGSFPKNYDLEIQGADYPASFISEKFNLKGPSLAFSTACSSGAASIIKGCQLLNSGIADCVIAGGVDIASDTVLIGFNSLEAVSPEITNPFSRNRNGITLGEGAAFLILSKENIFGEENPVKILGYGESCDAYHATSPDPTGNGAAKAMIEALKKAKISAESIDYINLHGTGTMANDSMESIAVSQVFGEKNPDVCVSTTKPLTGHTLGAAGSLEAAICILTLKNNFNKSGKEIKLPLQIWDEDIDENIAELNFVSKNKNTEKISFYKKDVFSSENKPVKTVMSNSFAFGGSNASLIFAI